MGKSIFLKLKVIWPSLQKYIIGFILGSWITMIFGGSGSLFTTKNNELISNSEANPIISSEQADKESIENNDEVNSHITSSDQVINEDGVYELPENTKLDSNGIILVGSSNKKIVEDAMKEDVNIEGQAYIEISSDVNPVYWIMDKDHDIAMWYYTISFEELNGVGLTVDSITETFIMSNDTPGKLKHTSHEIENWWGTKHIDANGSMNVTGGMNSQLISYIIWSIKGIDDNNNQVEFDYVLPLSQFPLEKSSNFVTENSTYDTLNLRYNADFEIEVADGVYWVSANELGSTHFTNQQIESMLSLSPEEKSAKITNLYEAIQLYQVGSFKPLEGNESHIQSGVNGVGWEYHIPGKLAVEINAGDCSTSSAWLTYLLKDDYDEVGHILYSQQDGNGHIFNYIKQDGYYYFIDMTKYRLDSEYKGIESGMLEDYRQSDFVNGNIHRVKNIQDYVNYINKSYNDPPELISMVKGTETLDIGVTKSDSVTIYYPSQREVTIVYDNPKDSVFYKMIDKADYVGNWDFVKRNPIVSSLPFK